MPEVAQECMVLSRSDYMTISASIPEHIAEPMHDRAMDDVKPVDPVDPVTAALSSYPKFKELMPESISEDGYWDGEFMLMLFHAYQKRDEALTGKLMFKVFDRYVSKGE